MTPHAPAPHAPAPHAPALRVAARLRLTGASAIALMLAAPALGQQAHPETGEALAADQSFTYRLLDEFPTLDPQRIEETAGSHVVRDLFEALLNQDGTGALVPGVATEWEANEDNTAFTFTLREDARWSNGDPVTAEDFVYAWRRAVDPQTASPYSWYLELAGIEGAADIIAGEADPETLGVEADGDHTLRVTLDRPTPFFDAMVTYSTFMPVHRATIEAHGDAWTRPGNMVSNGAYVLAEHVPNEYHVRERSDTYWDAGNVVIETVTGLVINDENQALTRYLAGELDFTDIPAGRFPEMQAQHPDEATSVPDLCSYYYGVNLRDGAMEDLQDERVRRALSLAIDRDVIVDQILQGGQTPAYSFTHPATAGFEPPVIDYSEMTQAERDAEAQRLMEEAGVEGLTVNLIYNTSDSHRQIATVVSQMWRQKLGVTATLSNYEWQTYLDVRREGNFDVARGAWCGDYNEASTFLDLWTSSNDSNDVRYSNPDYDQMLRDAREDEDPLPVYQEAERILAQDMPILPVYHYANVFMLDASIRGWAYENVQDMRYSKDLYRVADEG